MIRLGSRLIKSSVKIFEKNHNTFIPAFGIHSFVQTTTVKTEDSRSSVVASPQVVCLVNCVQELGFNEEEITHVIQKHPNLIKKSPALWKDILGSFMHFGMMKEDILLILEKSPHVLSLKKNELDRNLLAWFECGFGDELTLELLTTLPDILQVNHSVVEKRVKQYQSYFESKKRVGKLLLSAPNVLEDSWDELLDKLNYLDELCTDKSDIASSGVLAHSSLHIKARHEFLIRAGLYKRPTKEFNKRLSKNPKLSTIVNSSNEEFASRVARLSLVEYEVFLEMFEKECDESKSRDLDSDEDEEELNKLSYRKHLKSSRR